MKLDSNDLNDEQPINPRFAFAKPDANDHMALSDNLSPQLSWHDAPEGTKSFAVVCVDPDVPSVADDVNQEGKSIPTDLARVDFYHWSLIDLPPETTDLATGECSQGVTVGGKQNPPGPAGTRQGLNDYTNFLAGSEMEGQYYGYDGPCPPWNDERLHHYIFTVYALSVAKLDLPDDFSGHDVVQALQDHVLDKASITGSYTLNPNVN